MAAMKIYAIGGLLLLLTSPVWLLGVRLPWEQKESVWVFAARMQAIDWACWLGVLALALSVLQAYVVLSKGMKTAVAGLFLLGSVLMSYGTMRGFGEDHGVHSAFVIGIALVAWALVENLVGVLRFPPKAKI